MTLPLNFSGIFNFLPSFPSLEPLHANGGRFEINQLLFEDDAAVVADSEEKLLLTGE